VTGRLRQGKRVLLVIEDDPDTSSLLGMYFSGYEYDVTLASRGDEGLAAARRKLPDVILLDIGLPDIDGYAVCSALRASPRTSHIPVIFLSEKASVSDRVAGLGAGAQDYITKPFDLEELRLRVQNLISRSLRDNLVDPRSKLPTSSWLDEQLGRGRERPGWHVLECRIEAFQPFVDQNGFMAGDDVLKFIGQLLREVVDQLGSAEDFIGHPARSTFVILTGAADAAELARQLQARFNEDVQAHYSFMDREQGYLLLRGAGGEMVQAPVMTMNVTIAGQPSHS
jgi:PleD family two-component response regulator